MNELDCIIYIDWDGTREALSRIIAERTGVGLDANRPFLQTGEIALIRIDNNPYARGAPFLKNDEYFLRYPYRLETEVVQGVDFEKYVAFIGVLIVKLRNLGMNVIPACEFEHLLPST